MAEGLGLARPGGMIISEVHPQSPLCAGDAAAGDVILTVDGAAGEHPGRDALSHVGCRHRHQT